MEEVFGAIPVLYANALRKQTMETTEEEKLFYVMKKRIEELEDYIFEICDIIYMQCPLEQQDAWLKAMMDRRLYKSELDNGSE